MYTNISRVLVYVHDTSRTHLIRKLPMERLTDQPNVNSQLSKTSTLEDMFIFDTKKINISISAYIYTFISLK